MMDGRVWVAVMVAGVLALASCKTGKPVEEKEGAEGRTAPREFRPASALSRLHFERGTYPDLFASSSYAMWVDERVTALRRGAAAKEGEAVDSETVVESAYIAGNYVVLECHMDSVFPDMSIAYDVVGGRGVSMYLMTPQGRRAPPMQTLIGTDAREEQREALKLFGRTNLLIFPKRDLWLREHLVDPDAAVVRLVLEGYDSTFYFEWAGASADAVWQPTGLELDEILKTGYHEFHKRVRRLVHMFD